MIKKIPKKPSCIDVILTAYPKPFINTQTPVTGISEFHKLVLTFLKIHHEKPSLKVVIYGYYKRFFDWNLSRRRFQQNKKVSWLFFYWFNFIFLAVLNKHAQIKKDTSGLYLFITDNATIALSYYVRGKNNISLIWKLMVKLTTNFFGKVHTLYFLKNISPKILKWHFLKKMKSLHLMQKLQGLSINFLKM